MIDSDKEIVWTALKYACTLILLAGTGITILLMTTITR
jgi:hypothetical protein